MEQGYTSFEEAVTHCEQPSFDWLRDAAVQFLPNDSDKLNQLHEELEGGTAILEDDDHLNQYWRSYGPIHKAKLYEAYGRFPDLNIFAEEVEVYDWGCGQGLASICFLDHMVKLNKKLNIRAINLIEPSKIAIERAQFILQQYSSEITIRATCKKLDEIQSGDPAIKNGRAKIHLFSNIIDVETFDLHRLANLICCISYGSNTFFCVSPLYPRAWERVQLFTKLISPNDNDLHKENNIIEKHGHSAKLILHSFTKEIRPASPYLASISQAR